MYQLATPGMFKSVNGHVVQHHLLPQDLMSQATTWEAGRPHAIVFHYQAGCGADLYEVQKKRGYPIIAFSVALDGTIYQYCDARVAPWHAYAVSKYALGVEHAALPGTCDLNDKQLEASAALFAALIEWVQHQYGFSIPVQKVALVTPQDYRDVKGIYGHDDIEHGSSLNPTTHTDTLYHWAWDKYLGKIKSHLNVPKPGPAYPGHPLLLGMDDPAIVLVKRRLEVLGFGMFNQTPHFGGHLDSVVIAFQGSKGLTRDGVIGPLTWAKMWSK